MQYCLLSGVTMIGAMPAVAVRHERRKQEKRTKRPSQLYLGGYGLKHPSPPSRGSSPTPSPLQSPPTQNDDAPREFYIGGKVSVLHLVVVSLLLGAILLIVGLVQLTPNADANQHRYYLMAIGGFLMVLGFILTGLRCCVLPWYMRRRRRIQLLQRVKKDESQGSTLGLAGPAQTSTDNEKNTQVEMQNGMKSVKVNGEFDELVNAEMGLVNGSVSSVADTAATDPLPPRVSVSSSGDGLHTVMTSPSEHDALIKESSSNLEQASSSAT
ncbi:hypothetical protein L9F63_017327 [Diploptera punctata]|uniref:Uncharacterized protein n=1 Tax=Diploptera punctata TaxID=6984 RepID=A0AAD8EGP3_DIPPU|nr:hypothetical protein L9F63_017327 [Diploptera punctata]